MLSVKRLPMAHTIKEKSKLLARVRRIRGQLEAIERGLHAEIGCADILQLVASVRGAFNGLKLEKKASGGSGSTSWAKRRALTRNRANKRRMM